MKKFVLAAAAAASLVAGASPAAAATATDMGPRDHRGQVTHNVQVDRHVQVTRNVQVDRYAGPARGFGQAHRWIRGDRFDRRYAPNYQVIGRHAGLYAAPRGYQWVRSGNDAVLVSIASGLVGALIANLF